VQDTLAKADRLLLDYVRERPLPFYPWLRQIAADRLADAHRRHLHAGKRSVRREEPAGLPEESAVELAERLLAGNGPSAGLRREERRARVRSALGQLASADREVQVLRYLEQLTTTEAAAVLGVTRLCFTRGSPRDRTPRSATASRSSLNGVAPTRSATAIPSTRNTRSKRSSIDNCPIYIDLRSLRHGLLI
jgi:RNA polymerase sigma factor (sigma-70 family)